MARFFGDTSLRSVVGKPVEERSEQPALPRHPLTEATDEALKLALSIQIQNTLENEWGRYRYEGVGLE